MLVSSIMPSRQRHGSSKLWATLDTGPVTTHPHTHSTRASAPASNLHRPPLLFQAGWWSREPRPAEPTPATQREEDVEAGKSLMGICSGMDRTS